MNLPTFIIKNALRNKRRALLSVLSVAVSLFLLVTLQVALRELTNPISDEGSSLRIIVRNKVSLAQPLPARQLQVLDRIPGIVAVSPPSSAQPARRQPSVTPRRASFAIARSSSPIAR